MSRSANVQWRQLLEQMEQLKGNITAAQEIHDKAELEKLYGEWQNLAAIMTQLEAAPARPRRSPLRFTYGHGQRNAYTNTGDTNIQDEIDRAIDAARAITESGKVIPPDDESTFQGFIQSARLRLA